MTSNKITASIVWKLLERGGFHGAKLLIQIIMARILMPEDFGVIAILLVFVDLCTIFVQSGLNTALVQAKDATEEDFSSVFWVSLGVSVVLYGVLYLAAPLVAVFYENEAITVYLRAIGVVLLGGAVNSIQIAYTSRQFNFRAQFTSNSVAVIVSGIAGIASAYLGAGAWALIIQQIIWQYLNCVMMFILVKWKPVFVINWSRVKILLRFGWKMLSSSLLMRINTITSNLIVGKQFSAGSLAFFTKAQNFPTTFCDVVVGAYSSVTLASVSAIQDEKENVKNQMRSFVQSNCFFVAPMLIGLACVGKAFIQVLLTDAWLGCVPFLQIFCAMYLFQPLCSIYGQSISGVGRSDLYFLALLVAKPAGFALMILMAIFTDNALYLAVSLVLATVIETVIQAVLVKKLFRYKFREQLKDWLQPIAASLIMAVPVCALSGTSLSPLAMLLAQVAVGVAVYAIAGWITGCPPARTLLDLLRKRITSDKSHVKKTDGG